MKSIEKSIPIKASTSQVWKILMNFEAYPEWNPFVTQISGKAVVDEQLKVSIQLPSQNLQHFEPKVLVIKEKEEFRWAGKLFVTGLFDGEHYFKLETISANETKLIHGEKFTGLLVKPIMSMIGDKTAMGFEAMNQALKTRAEQTTFVNV